MLTLACLCGGVKLGTERRPDFVHACNCTLCRKTGAQWGYFAPEDVHVMGPTQGWRRADKPEPSAEIAFCPTCGATTHFTLTERVVDRHGHTMMGVNCALASEQELAGIELRFPDGAGWEGDGPFGYVRPSRIIGAE